MLDTLFDDVDSDLKQINWTLHNAGYAIAGSHKGERYAHRRVLSRKLSRKLEHGEMCDHINQNKLDNRRDNLRLANKSINSINRGKRPDNTSGFTGVYKIHSKEAKEKRWKPSYSFRIQRKGFKTFYSRRYKTAYSAHLARIEKLKDYEY